MYVAFEIRRFSVQIMGASCSYACAVIRSDYEVVFSVCATAL